MQENAFKTRFNYDIFIKLVRSICIRYVYLCSWNCLPNRGIYFRLSTMHELYIRKTLKAYTISREKALHQLSNAKIA